MRATAWAAWGQGNAGRDRWGFAAEDTLRRSCFYLDYKAQPLGWSPRPPHPPPSPPSAWARGPRCPSPSGRQSRLELPQLLSPPHHPHPRLGRERAACGERGRFSEKRGTHSAERPWTRRPCHGGPSPRCQEVAAPRVASAAPWPPGRPSRPGAGRGPEQVGQCRLLPRRARQSGSAAHS